MPVGDVPSTMVFPETIENVWPAGALSGQNEHILPLQLHRLRGIIHGVKLQDTFRQRLQVSNPYATKKSPHRSTHHPFVKQFLTWISRKEKIKGVRLSQHIYT